MVIALIMCQISVFVEFKVFDMSFVIIIAIIEDVM